MGLASLRRSDAIYAALVILSVSARDGIAQNCASRYDGSLVLVEENSVTRLSPDGARLESLPMGQTPILGMAYDYKRNELYFSDLGSRQIYSLRDGSSKAELLVPSQKSWIPISIAHDAVTDKLYVAETFSDSVRIVDLAKRENEAILIGSNLTDLKDVEIDTSEGYLFVLDRYQIVRSDLDGSNLKVIKAEFGKIDDIYNELFPPVQTFFAKSLQQADEESRIFRKDLAIGDLLVDPKSQRLYWVNTLTRTIHSSDYEGQNVQTHFQDQSARGSTESLSSLALLGGFLYWSDMEANKVFKVSLANEKDSRVILKTGQPLHIMAVSCANRQTGQNPCAVNNGQCQQFCLLARSSKSNYRCACNVGLELAGDARSCASVQDFLLYTQDSLIRGRRLSGSGNLDAINPSMFEAGSGNFLDFDAEQGLVLYSSLFPNNKLHQLRLANGETKLIQPDLLSKDVYNFAYDWTTKNIYYFTYYYADVTTLSVTNVRNPTYSKILIDNVPRLVRAIVAHPNRGYIYFSQLVNDQRGTISRMAMDGSGLTVLISLSGKASAEGLAIDQQEDRLYWSEQQMDQNFASRIRHSNLDGKDVRDIELPKNFKRPSSLVIQGDYIYAIVGPDKSLVRLNKRRPGDEVSLVDSQRPGKLSGLKVFSRSLQTTAAGHPCAGQHRCQKFCFAVPSTNGSLRAVCGCPYGEKLAVDGRSCEDNSKLEPPFVPCPSTSYKCNKQTAAAV